MKTDPFHNLGPDQAVRVLPRYLAGPGTVDPRTVWPFPFDEGWAFAQAQDGTAAAFSPCLRLQTTYEPRSTRKPKGAWTLSQHAAPFTPPDWRIVFDGLTPAELVRDVHAELFDCYVDDRYKSKKDELFLGWPGKHEVYAHLFTRGWSHQVNTDGTHTSAHRTDLPACATATTPPAAPRTDLNGKPGAVCRASRPGRPASRSEHPAPWSRPSPPHSPPPNRCTAPSGTFPATPAAPSTSPPPQASGRAAPPRQPRHPRPRPQVPPDDRHRCPSQGVIFLVNTRFVRSAATAFTAAGTLALALAPAADAETSEPTPSTAPTTTPAPSTGSIEITTKDTAGGPLPGAAFLLLDSTGRQAGHASSDDQGKLTLPNLAPGVYRLEQTASGSPLHEAAADQDVIVTPGTTTRLTITDRFKAATVLVQVKNDKTGKPLPGARVNIGTGTTALLTLTTGTQGTASGELPVSSRSTTFWAKSIKAPAGYDLDKPTKVFTAGPGNSVTVTITGTRSASGTNPAASATLMTAPAAHGLASTAADARRGAAKPPAPALAETGADATGWLATGAGLLMALGIASLTFARRPKADKPEPSRN